MSILDNVKEGKSEASESEVLETLKLARCEEIIDKMPDATELEHSFSHFIHVLIGSISSTILISLGLLMFNFKMAVATLWVVPIYLGLGVFYLLLRLN